MAKNDLTITVRLRDFASRTLKGITRNFASFTKKLVTFPFKLIATGFKRIAQVGLLAISAALGKLAFDVQKFEAEFKKVVTLLDKDSFKDMGISLKEGIKFLESEAINTMAKFGLTIEDTNKALFDTISAGVPASEAIEFLNESAKLAIAGVTDLSVATDGMTSIFNVFKGEIKEVSQISRAFFTAQKFGKTTVAALASNIGKVAPIAKAAGVSFQELLAATAQLTLGGLSTEEATTALRASLSALISPSIQAKKVFEDLEIPFGKAALTGGNLGKTLGILAEKSKGNVDVLAKLIPNIRALTGVTALDADALANLDRIIEAVTNDTVSLDAAFQEQFSTFSRQFKVFNGQLRRAAIIISKDFLPRITEIVSKLGEAVPEIAISGIKFIAEIRKTLNNAIAETKIAGEKIKQNLVNPLEPRNFKSKFKDFVTNFKENLKKIRESSDELNKQVVEDQLDFANTAAETEEEFQGKISKIREEAALKNLEIEQGLQEKLAELRNVKKEQKDQDNQDELDANAQKNETIKQQETDLFSFLSILDKKKLQQSKEFFSFIIQGTRSSNAAVATIAKAAALFDIAVKTKQAAMNAMATIPPPFNFAAAGAAIAFGLEQASAVASLKPGFQDGGIVPGNSRRGDNVDVRANSGEAILTGAQQKRFMDIADGGAAPSASGGDLTVNLNVDGTALAQTVIEGYNSGRNLDLITPISTE